MSRRKSLQGIAAFALAGVAFLASGESRRAITIKIDRASLIQQPSIAWKHLTLEGVTLDAPVIEVDLSCSVARQTGALDCTRGHGESAGADYVVAAIRRSRAMRLDPAKLRTDSLLPLTANLTVLLASGDRRTVNFLGEPKLKMSDVEWTAVPSADDLAAAYPADLRRQGLGATVNLVCEIESDRSVLCVTTNPEPVGDAKAQDAFRQFSWAGRAVMSLYAAAPKLKSGASSSGAIISTSVDFKPQD